MKFPPARTLVSRFCAVVLLPALFGGAAVAPGAALAGSPTPQPIPTLLISGNFGRGLFQIGMIGLGSASSPQPVSLDPSVAPLLDGTYVDQFYARDTDSRFAIPAITATAGLTAALSSEVVRAVRGHRPIDFKRLYQDAILATGAGFAVGTLFAPGIPNHFMARAVIDASLRYLAQRTLLGADARSAAGSLEADLIVGALRGAVESQLPMEVLTWLPCQSQDLPADICNGLHALAAKALLQGGEEVASQLLTRALDPSNPRASNDLKASFARGAAFGATEQAMIEVALGAPQWMSPADRRRVGEAFDQAGMTEGTVECLEKTTFLYGGIWSAFTQRKDLNFNIGTTTMTDREFYFLDSDSPRDVSVLGHEVGGHCTQWLSLGLVNFLGRYIFNFARTDQSPEMQAVYTTQSDEYDCTGNPYECEANAIQVIVRRQLSQ